MGFAKMIMLGIAAALAGPNVQDANCENPLMARVTNYVERPLYDSGTIAVWTKVMAVDKNNVSHELYMIYFGEAQKLPRKGQVCCLCYQYGTVNGLVGRTGAFLRNVKLIDEIECL